MTTDTRIKRSAYVSKDSRIITEQVDGHGAGFPHIGIEVVARSLGYGPVGTGYGFQLVTSQDVLTWDGRPGALVGWLVTAYVPVSASVS